MSAGSGGSFGAATWHGPRGRPARRGGGLREPQRRSDHREQANRGRDQEDPLHSSTPSSLTVSSSRDAAKLERTPQEAARALVVRIVEHVCGHALLDDPALVHEDEPVADLAGELHLVGDDEHRHPDPSQVAHHDQHLADELRIERGGDLVEEHHVRLHHQRARDRDALLLAARELMRIVRRLLLEPDRRQQHPRPRLRLRARQLPDLARGERDVVDRAQVREEVELLEDHPDPLAHARDVDALAR